MNFGSFVSGLKSKANELKNDATGKGTAALAKAKERVNQAKNSAEDKLDAAESKAGAMADRGKEIGSQVMSQGQDKAGQFKGFAKSQLNDLKKQGQSHGFSKNGLQDILESKVPKGMADKAKLRDAIGGHVGKAGSSLKNKAASSLGGLAKKLF